MIISSIFDNLAFTCNAILPIILCILLGYFLKRVQLLPDNFWKMANKLCFRVCLPTLLFYNIYNVKDITGIAKQWKVVLFAVIAILIVFFLGLLYINLYVNEDKQKGVLLQCIFRSNFAIIGVSIAQELSNNNPDVTSIAAIISAISIPLYNILAILSLTMFIKEDGKKVSIQSTLKKIVTNPLIIGVFTGIVVLCFRELLSIGRDTPLFTIKENAPFIYKTIENVKSIASPLALIALGGDFTFSAISKLKDKIIIGTIARCIIVPAACLTAAYLINKDGKALGLDNNVLFPSLIALYGTPVAVSSAPMAAEMNNDEELAGQLVVWTSIASAFTLFIFIFVFTSLGVFTA